MLDSDLSSAAPQEGREPPTDKTCVVSTRRRVPTNWVSGRTLQPSIESVVANSFVPSDFLVHGQVSGLGTVHPLLTLDFYSTWILPLHVVSSTSKRKSSSSAMDGLQRSTAPSYVADMLHKKPLHTRSSSNTMPLLNRSAHSMAKLGDLSFSFASSSVWNSIPNYFRCAPSLSSSKSRLKTYLFRPVYKD